jgi:hypothetical protein
LAPGFGWGFLLLSKSPRPLEFLEARKGDTAAASAIFQK